MAVATVGLLHPGEMGAAVGAVLRGRGHRVVWASEGRGTETRERAEEAGLEDAGSVEELGPSDVILSVCPPHAALEVAGAVAGFGRVFVDANAIAPGTAREVEAVIAAGGGDCVDGGIVGAPPRAVGTTRLLPDLPERSQRAARSANAKGWRWVGEMEEIASTFAAAGLPDGFHRAAAEVFRTRSPGGQAR
jgi:hypothetical protein